VFHRGIDIKTTWTSYIISRSCLIWRDNSDKLIIDHVKGLFFLLFKQIKYFVSVVECNSFTEAAEQCYISQPAISQQIQALEKDLGVELIHRENRSFSLTPAGEYFYRHGTELLAEADELRRETIRIGQDDESQLRIGYLWCYNGQELHEAIAEFSSLYPGVDINTTTGTHEELYDLLRFNGIDLALSDQRRAFSEAYINFHLLYGDFSVEVSVRSRFGAMEKVTTEDLKRAPCILISPKEQQNTEQEFYQNIIGLGGNFLFASNPEEARLMVVGNRGFLPVDGVGTLAPPGTSIIRLPLYRDEHRVRRNYCAFWRKERSNYYIEEFAEILRGLLCKETHL